MSASGRTQRPTGNAISPDEFPGGTDHDKLQAAVNYCTGHGYPTIILDRMLDLTGAAPVSIDKAVWSLRNVVTFQGDGGGITKNSAGAVFTSATVNTGDILIKGLKLVSTAGAGAIMFDGEMLIRIHSEGCEWLNWDYLISQTSTSRYLQSVRFHKEHVTGGGGTAAILCRQAYDVTIDDCLFEDRGTIFANSDGTMTGIANRQLRIVNNLMENLSAPAIKLAMSWPFIIDGNYFESVGAATDPTIDLYNLTKNSAQFGILSGNSFQPTTDQQNAHTPAVLLGATSARAITSESNIVPSGCVLYKMGNPSSTTVYGSNDYAELPSGMVIFPGQEDRYVTPAGKTTTTAGRPKNPRIGEPYFDTDLGKLITAKTAGKAATASLTISAGATTSGTVTVTVGGTAYSVTVAAGDTITGVRDKIVSSLSGQLWPTWAAGTYSTDSATINAYAPGVKGSLAFNGGSTGVTSSYFAYNTAGTDPVWVDGSGTTV